MMTESVCAECLEMEAVVMASAGAMLCAQCAGQFYAACAGCGVLVAKDEAAERGGTACCLACLAKPEGDEAEALGEEELGALVGEFVQLQAENKRLEERLGEIKEKLKRHAATQPRVSNAVVLRAGEHAVKCGYSARVSYDAERLSAAELLLGPETFASLFAREVKYSPHKDSLEEFLAHDDEETSAARAAILAAAERRETATLTVVPAKGGAGKASSAGKTTKKTAKSAAQSADKFAE
jgi:regulator of replication initiation timing